MVHTQKELKQAIAGIEDLETLFIKENRWIKGQWGTTHVYDRNGETPRAAGRSENVKTAPYVCMMGGIEQLAYKLRENETLSAEQSATLKKLLAEEIAYAVTGRRSTSHEQNKSTIIHWNDGSATRSKVVEALAKAKLVFKRKLAALRKNKVPKLAKLPAGKVESVKKVKGKTA